MSNVNVPAGTENDPRAPWNDTTEYVDVKITTTEGRTLLVEDIDKEYFLNMSESEQLGYLLDCIDLHDEENIEDYVYRCYKYINK